MLRLVRLLSEVVEVVEVGEVGEVGNLVFQMFSNWLTTMMQNHTDFTCCHQQCGLDCFQFTIIISVSTSVLFSKRLYAKLVISKILTVIQNILMVILIGRSYPVRTVR